MSERIDYGEFYQRILELVTDKSTGTLYARTNKNHLVIVAVRDGRIVSLACGPKRGDAAVPLIRQMVSADVRLDDSAIPYHERELPPTERILAVLEPGTWASVNDSATTPAASHGTMPADIQGKAQALCELLTDYIGPAAPLVCEEKLSTFAALDNPQSIDSAITNLAAEIQDSREAREFDSRARLLLQETSDSRPVATTEAPSPGPESGIATVNMGRVRDSLCDLLTGYLGPVAPLICDEKVATMSGGGHRHEFEAAINDIAGEIEDRKEADEFVTKAWQRLQALGV